MIHADRSWNEVLFPYALNDNRELVSAVEAPRHEKYFCAGCGDLMHIRRGQKNRPHFSHDVETHNCSPESVLHKLAKSLIKTGIERALGEGRAYEFTWYCQECGGRNQGDLAKTPRQIELEVWLDNIRPDVLVSNVAGKHLVVIEIVVTHKPEVTTSFAYESRKLPVLIIEVDWNDLPGMALNLLHVSPKVLNGICRAPEHPLSCPNCKKPMEEIELNVWQGYRCHKCKKPMPVLFFSKRISAEEGALRHISRMARKLKVPFKTYRTNDGYLDYAHQCYSCGTWASNLYVYTGRYGNWFPDPDEPTRSCKCFWCERCDNWKVAC